MAMSSRNDTNLFDSFNKKKFPTRQLGQTRMQVSAIGFGGIVVMNAEPDHAAKVVAESVAAGINYFDVAPTYGDAEIKLGPALKPFRKDVFLACKTTQRNKKEAAEELENSLKQLQTDYLDVYQLHALTDVEKDVKTALSKTGAIQTFLEAKKNGIIRNIGFSAHSPAAALTAMKEFDFDTIMYPINFCTHFNSGFETQVLAEAKKRKMGIIAIKAIAKQKWQNSNKRDLYPKCWYEPIDNPQTAQKALNWAYEQGISLALPPGEEKLFKMCVDLAPKCIKLSKNELQELENLAKESKPIF